MAPFVDHYAVLGVKPTANPVAIKKAYHQRALQYHPDKAAACGKVDAAKFISAQAAYEVLIDTTKRKAFDAQYKKRSKTCRASRSAHKRATRASRSTQRETDGSYGGGYGPAEMRGDEEDEARHDYPSDTPTDHGSDYEDSGVYEDAYVNPQRYYKSHHSSSSVVDGSSASYGTYTQGGLDSTDDRHQFPEDCGNGNECNTDSEDHSDGDDRPALRLPHPVTEAFDFFATMSKSHYLEEKVLGRYYKGALLELQTHKTECTNIDAQLLDIAARVRRRVSGLPAGSIRSGEFEEALARKMAAAHGAVGEVRAAAEASARVMRAEQQPRFWQLMDKRTWGVIETLERGGMHMGHMREVLAGLEEIVIGLEGWPNERLGSVKRYLASFMLEFRDWRKEITSRYRC